MKLLVIEDDRLTQRLTAMVLTRCGHEVDMASNVEEAIQLLQQRTYDLITCDFFMPGQTGFDFLRIRNDMPDWIETPVILLTGSDDSSEAAQAFALGAAGVLRKPINATQFEEMVKTCMPRRQPPS